MKAALVTLPTARQERLGGDAALQFMAVGNTALLDEPLLGLIASRQCPGQVLLETLDLAAQWARAQQVVLSGFHSPLEQQVLRSMLRRHGRVVKLLARCFGDEGYQPDISEWAALEEGRMAVISAFGAETPRITRSSSLERNRMVLTLATEIVVPFVSPSSPLAALIAEFNSKLNFRESDDR